MPRFPLAFAVATGLLLACSACGPTPPPAEPARRASAPAGEAHDTAAPKAEAGWSAPGGHGDRLRYDCDDGSVVRVTYGDGEQARLELPGGPTVSLPKAQSASKGGGDVFVGETVSLQRDGDALQVVQTGGAALQCRASTDVE